jgi:Plant calmodulin-binding domain
MVQRKEPTKLRPKTKHVSKPRSFDLHGSPISKGTASADISKNKTMKYLPNYMKPTSSSDARNDQLQVTHRNSPSITNSTRKSNPKSASPPSVTSKRKALTPFLKRNKSKVLFQKLNLNRATCSSTLKDSKFPKALDLNPGGTESEGTSLVRVCPYTYCSLNGHVHEPMPPLKSFLVSKRKLIKTQQSMKLKGFSPFRKRELKRSKEVSPLFQEVVNDFIVEIYASTKEKIVDQVKTEERTAGVCSDSEREEAVSTALDLKSDFSVEEMDAMVKLVEYMSCDQEVEAVTEKCSDPLVEEIGEENSVGFDENCAKFESFKEFDADYMDDADVFSDSGSFSSERTDMGSDRSHDQLFELNGESVVEEMDMSISSESDFQNEVTVGITEEESGNCSDSEVVSERKDNEIPSQLLENIDDQKLDCKVNLDDEGNNTDSEVASGSREEKLYEIETSDISEHEIATRILENTSKDNEEEETKDDKIQEVEESNSIIELEEEEYHQEETEMSGELDQSNEKLTNTKEQQEDVNETGMEGDSELQAAENLTRKETESDPEIERPDPNQPKEEAAVAKETSQIDQLCVAFSEMQIEGEDYSFDPTCQQKSRLIIARRRLRNGEDEYMREFNPRAPNFLPVEPDPESEKVDLRHQMMDERKNAEEWMLDYALRKAVDQLAPARKKKVELLVAAFETVVPVVPVRGGGVTCS